MAEHTPPSWYDPDCTCPSCTSQRLALHVAGERAEQAARIASQGRAGGMTPDAIDRLVENLHGLGEPPSSLRDRIVGRAADECPECHLTQPTSPLEDGRTWDHAEGCSLKPRLVNPRLVVTKDGEKVYDGPPEGWTLDPPRAFFAPIPMEAGEAFGGPRVSLPEPEYDALVAERDGLRLGLAGAERELAAAKQRVEDLDAANGILQRGIDEGERERHDAVELHRVLQGEYRGVDHARRQALAELGEANAMVAGRSNEIDRLAEELRLAKLQLEAVSRGHALPPDWDATRKVSAVRGALMACAAGAQTKRQTLDRIAEILDA